MQSQDLFNTPLTGLDRLYWFLCANKSKMTIFVNKGHGSQIETDKIKNLNLVKNKLVDSVGGVSFLGNFFVNNRIVL